jgi:hypothetical protein
MAEGMLVAYGGPSDDIRMGEEGWAGPLAYYGFLAIVLLIGAYAGVHGHTSQTQIGGVLFAIGSGALIAKT